MKLLLLALALSAFYQEPSALPDVDATPTAAAAATATPAFIKDPYEVLRRARDAFHAHDRPPYIAYNLERSVWIDDIPNGDFGFMRRVWCRTSDAAALEQPWNPFRKRAIAELHFIRPTLLLDVDPGPPTADIFEPPPPPRPHPAASAPFRTIAVVAKAGDLDYRASLKIERGLYHLKLSPLRDEERNRLRDVWLEPQAFEVVRAIEVNRPGPHTDDDPLQSFYSDGFLAPVQLEMRFAPVQGVPIITHATEIATVIPTYKSLGHRIEIGYVFDRFAFSTDMPAWYFEPKTYRARHREAPSY